VTRGNAADGIPRQDLGGAAREIVDPLQQSILGVGVAHV
jgi:hypothetical protein